MTAEAGAAAHDTPIKIDGDVFYVRRDFDLMKRIEQSFGPLSELDGKLRRTQLTGVDLVRLVRIVLAGQASGADDDTIQRHIMDTGVLEVSNALAIVVVHMFAGHRKAVAWLEAEARRGEGADGENPHLAA